MRKLRMSYNVMPYNLADYSQFPTHQSPILNDFLSHNHNLTIDGARAYLI